MDLDRREALDSQTPSVKQKVPKMLNTLDGAQSAGPEGPIGPGPSSLRPPGSEQLPPQGIPIPAALLPLSIMFGVVQTQEGEPMIVLTAMNPSGSMTQGAITAEQASKLGRDLLGAAHQAQARAPKKLVVPGGLALPV